MVASSGTNSGALLNVARPAKVFSLALVKFSGPLLAEKTPRLLRRKKVPGKARNKPTSLGSGKIGTVCTWSEPQEGIIV